MSSTPEFIFFGTPDLAVTVLNELERSKQRPRAVVTGPDEKKGRGLKLASPPVKEWADQRGITVHQPQKLDEAMLRAIGGADVFVVVAYGKILPKTFLQAPQRGVLNVHPSLLPRLRGASPIRSAIVNDEKKVGVTVMQLDEEMDHGPIVAQKAVDIAWPPRASDLEALLMREGGALLATVLPEWVKGHIEAREQNHDIATYCEKIEKEDGLLDLAADGYKNLLKILGYEGWPGTYAYFVRAGKRMRVQILDAHLENGSLSIDTVKPEGKKEMPYADFLRSGAKPV